MKAIVWICALGLVVGACDSSEESPTEESTMAPAGTSETHVKTGNSDRVRIAYINNDSLTVKYKRLETLNKELADKQVAAEKRLAALEQELMGWYAKMEKEFPLMAKSDQEKAQQELQRRQIGFEKEKERLANELAELQNKILSGHLETITRHCKEYAQENGYDFIMVYQPGGEMLYGNPSYDVTDAIVDRLNKEHTDLTGGLSGGSGNADTNE